MSTFFGSKGGCCTQVWLCTFLIIFWLLMKWFLKKWWGQIFLTMAFINKYLKCFYFVVLGKILFVSLNIVFKSNKCQIKLQKQVHSNLNLILRRHTNVKRKKVLLNSNWNILCFIKFILRSRYILSKDLRIDTPDFWNKYLILYLTFSPSIEALSA